MEAHDVIDRLDQVFPVFQPVFNTEEFRIIGYEVLGRIEQNGEPRSLASFFNDETVPAEYRWEAEKTVQDQAVKQVLASAEKPKLFFNLNAKVIFQLDCLEELMERFADYEAKGLSPDRVVFEFQVDRLKEQEEDFSHMLMYMKASGFHVAIDDIRINETNLDRFSRLEPNVMKVDLSDLRSGKDPNTYQDVLNALALFARKIGAILHFKGIGESFQLLQAWRHGGRFLQGTYLMKPVPSFQDPFAARPLLESNIHAFIQARHRKLKEQIAFMQSLEKVLAANVKGKQDDPDAFIRSITKRVHEVSSRIYVCDEFGYQISSNWVKNERGQWEMDPEAEGKNWSWRTYFLDLIMQMKYRKSGMLSDKYRDIETNVFIRTFSYPIDHERYVFIDIDPTYLFENDWLM
ncbi:EAL domain-containing protein [Salisediminibacterium halotolerans]|uniref:EAL domain, c-di-GMP-specific phosphodiesterase class I (Or its enzymatically inactive variant) n=1 Tax=Salisediminibacterium halotolerans TaxID=517425 RepID=A0A1H9RXM4_9BACI|nr:EAL domain-containing protein [Salisediminibacterium haloalkalitolerans]SER76863.1 EAL domain, c-di-GMP-specific phosphodiesterase class I (or its enzymatically inactive variant) [Salisediminibacterium haloalkalitolerans]